MKGIADEMKEASKALKHKRELGDLPADAVEEHHLHDLAARSVASGNADLYPQAARCYAEALIRGDGSYSRLQPVDPIATWRAIGKSLPDGMRDAYQELVCADAYWCHIFTSATLDRGFFAPLAALAEVSSNYRGVIGFGEILAKFLGPDALHGSKRISTLRSGISASNPDAAKAMSP